MNLKGFFTEHIKTIPFSWRRVWISVFVVVCILGIFGGSALLYAQNYSDRVLPGVYLGDTHIGGMTIDELREYLRNMHEKLLEYGIHFSFNMGDTEKNFVVYPSIVSEDVSRELVTLNIDEEVLSILEYGKDHSIFADTFSAIWIRLRKPHITLSTLKMDKEGVFAQIESQLGEYISDPVDAGIKVISLKPELVYEVSSSSAGLSFDYEKVAGHILKSWSVFESQVLVINSFEQAPQVLESDVASIANRLPKIFAYGRLDINFTDPHTTRGYLWYVSLEELADWLEVQKTKDGNFVFGLSQKQVNAFLTQDVAPVVNVEAQNAKFQIGSGGKVAEFQGSRPGVGVDMEQNYILLNDAIIGRTLHDEGIVKAVTMVATQVDPKIKTGEINNLGITEILGVGHSKFKGSPGNRIKNIKHAAFDKLHGILIKPGEEFSLIAALQPFTYADGYLPELVIKGDTIEPELGGGLCQIGTTMFRTAMNSGLPITERRNHSLVVPYYNDLSNGNPGTDATIYEPHPDFRFINDTGNYILISSEMNVATADLYFYFWGTKDGRRGYYSAPKVLKWIPTGPEKIIETTELAPGVKNCQDKHIGAEASFVYTRILASGEKIDHTFESYYRPLPRICLLGVEAKGEEVICDPTLDICEPISSDTQSPISSDSKDLISENEDPLIIDVSTST